MTLHALIQEGRVSGPVSHSAVIWDQVPSLHKSSPVGKEAVLERLWCPGTEMFLSGDRESLGQLVRAGFLCLYKCLCCLPCALLPLRWVKGLAELRLYLGEVVLARAVCLGALGPSPFK